LEGREERGFNEKKTEMSAVEVFFGMNGRIRRLTSWGGRLLLALALAWLCWAPAGAQVVARVDMLGGKLVPASSDPNADIASARAIDLGVARAVGGRNPPCLTAAEAARLGELARLLDALRTYIDTQERGWTGSGFPKHSDIPGHGEATAAEMTLDALKNSYWVLHGDYERLIRVKPCAPEPKSATPSTPGAGTTAAAPTGPTAGPQTGGGTAGPPTGGGAGTPGPQQPGPQTPEPPEGVPSPPATACRTAADEAYITEQTEALNDLIDRRTWKYGAMAYREKELAEAADPRNERFSGMSAGELRKIIDSDNSDVAQEKEDIAALDAEIFALRGYLAAERNKPPCEQTPQTPPAGGTGEAGAIPGDNPFAPPQLPSPPAGACRTAADDAYEAEVKAILDRSLDDRARLYQTLAPLLVEQKQIEDAIERAGGDAEKQAGLPEHYPERAASLGKAIAQIELKIEALDATISAAEARLKNKKPPCENGGSPNSSTVPAAGADNSGTTSPSQGQVAAPASHPSEPPANPGDKPDPNEHSSVLGPSILGPSILGPEIVHVQPAGQPNKRAGDDQQAGSKSAGR
jgi:hypothetical protein